MLDAHDENMNCVCCGTSLVDDMNYGFMCPNRCGEEERDRKSMEAFCRNPERHRMTPRELLQPATALRTEPTASDRDFLKACGIALD
jgi:predicted RNA-binding Zn-ribbon protein involved in translation (DUF1610 family)